MSLNGIKLILKRYVDTNKIFISHARRELKPNYSGYNTTTYNYTGIEESDVSMIYTAISLLEYATSNTDGAMLFNVETYFITERKALLELKSFRIQIDQYLSLLVELKNKYEGKECSHYPINVCVNYYREIHSILAEVFSSEEVKEFEEPGITNRLNNENLDLKFKIFWGKRKWMYIIHLILFIPFLVCCAFVIFHKEEKDLSKSNESIVLVLSGLITILFNLGFNNHNSFKDSFKLFTKVGRNNLYNKNKAEFTKITN